MSLKKWGLLSILIVSFGFTGCNQTKPEEKQAIESETEYEEKTEQKEETEKPQKTVSENAVQAEEKETKPDVIPGMKIEDIQPLLSELGVQEPTIEETESGYQVLAMDEYNVFGYIAMLDKDKDVKLISYTMRKTSNMSDDEFLDLASSFLSICAADISYDGAEPFRAEEKVESMVKNLILTGEMGFAEFGGITFSAAGEKDSPMLIVSKVTEPEQ